MLSLVIPVYKNEGSLDRLLGALLDLDRKLEGNLEAVFVVDGSPDRCLDILAERLPALPLRSQLLALSRNFGSFAAIAAGLEAGRGSHFAVLAADLQEPPELAIEFYGLLRSGAADVVFGSRRRRSDPWLSELAANLFWRLYRRFVLPDMPKGGVDVFGCTRAVRDRLLQFKELNTSLVALLFWLGFRRKFITYDRLPRRDGKSAWTLGAKLRYSLDSIFNFTDLPIRTLLYAGTAGVLFSLVFGAALVISKLLGIIPVPGYTATVLTIMFFGALTSLGFGIVGQYLWLALQNTRNRPPYVVASAREFSGAAHAIIHPREGNP